LDNFWYINYQETAEFAGDGEAHGAQLPAPVPYRSPGGRVPRYRTGHPAVWRTKSRAAGHDLNPIEMAFAKLKAHLRRIGTRTISALWEAVGSICDLYTRGECWNYLKHAGYVSD
jgi:hypothetical protein